MALFDLTDVKDSSFDVLPEGTYQVYLDEAKLKDNKAGTGAYINCKFVTLDGRVLYQMFNTSNPNPTAVKIGLEQLKSFMKCAGRTDFKLNSASELEGLKCLAIVKIKTDSYGEKNHISYFKPLPNSSETPNSPMELEKLPF